MTAAPRQLALDGRDSRVTISQMPWYGPGWWQAKCADCGGWLTKFDFTDQECHDLAVLELDRGHTCKTEEQP